jgi:DivIVA domain-containing protein
VTSERFQRPQTAAGANAVTASDLPPHPPDVRDEEVAELLQTAFPVGLRGYDRHAVDAYVQRVSRVIAELQASRSPQSAVRYALEQVSEQTRSILQQAHDTADQITTKSRHDASERMETAERESAELRSQAEIYDAETRAAADRDAREMRAAAERHADELRAAAERRIREAEEDVASIWHDRQRLVDDVREVSSRLSEVAEAAADREPPPAIEFTEGDTTQLSATPVWDSDPDDDGTPPPPPAWDDTDDMPAPAIRAAKPSPEPDDTPPPPAEAAPEPALRNAPPPPSEEPGPLAFELQEDAELGPMDEPAAPNAVDEASVPVDEDDTAERRRP